MEYECVVRRFLVKDYIAVRSLLSRAYGLGATRAVWLERPTWDCHGLKHLRQCVPLAYLRVTFVESTEGRISSDSLRLVINTLLIGLSTAPLPFLSVKFV